MAPVFRFVLLLLLGLAPGLARAHAELRGTEPQAGAVLAAPVPFVVFRFNEPVQPVSARLTFPDGETRPARLEAEGNTIRVLLAQSLSEGSYLAVLRVISADAHPVNASLAFSVGRESGLARAEAAEDDFVGLAALRWLRNLALLTGAGIGLYLALVGSGGSGASGALVSGATLASSLGLFLIILEFAAMGAQLTGSRDLLQSAFGAAAWSTSFADASLCQALGALILLVMPWANERMLSFLAPLGATVLAAGFALTGHAALDGSGLNPVVLALHALCAAFWLGSLVGLLGNLQDAKVAVWAVPRFSRIAVPAVGVLLAAGLALAMRIGLTSGLSWSAPYQLLLAGKLALAFLLLGIAAYNRLRLSPAIAAGDVRAIDLLRIAIAGEILLVAAILALTAFLSNTPPGSRLAGAAPPQRMALAADSLTADLSIAGRTIQARVGRAGGAAFAPLQVRLEALGPHGAEIGVDLTPEGDGFGGLLPSLPPGGSWRYCLVVLVSDFDRKRLCSGPVAP